MTTRIGSGSTTVPMNHGEVPASGMTHNTSSPFSSESMSDEQPVKVQHSNLFKQKLMEAAHKPATWSIVVGVLVLGIGALP